MRVLVHTRLVAHQLCPRCKVQRGHGLMRRLERRADVGNDGGLGVATKRVLQMLQQMPELVCWQACNRPQEVIAFADLQSQKFATDRV